MSVTLASGEKRTVLEVCGELLPSGASLFVSSGNGSDCFIGEKNSSGNCRAEEGLCGDRGSESIALGELRTSMVFCID